MKNRKTEIYILIFIVFLAIILRTVNLTTTPPGFNQDEACYIWNASCLIKTGHDQMGVHWPIFYTRGLGGNYATLFFYILLPFEAIGGMNIWIARFASALLGIITVILFYVSGKNLFGTQVGLICSCMLAMAPWHIHMSRVCIEGCVCPFAVITVLAILSQANLLTDNEAGARPVLATAGGIIAGISCYGYNAMRIFWPLFLLALFLATTGRVLKYAGNKHGLRAIIGFILGFTLIFAPLAYMHAVDSDGIGQHGKTQLLIYSENMSEIQIIEGIMYRYVNHFNPAYLFKRQNPDDDAVFYNYFFQWYLFPLAITGFVVLIPKIRNSIAARVLLVWVLVYPVSDSLGYFILPHHFRSSPGLCSLILLAAFGTVAVFKWLWNKNKHLSFVAITIMFFCVFVTNIFYWNDYFGRYSRRIPVYYAYHADLNEACQWLKPRFNDIDSVFITTNRMNQPYINTLVSLDYDPSQWFKDEHLISKSGEWDIHVKYGKMNFMYGDLWLPIIKELQENGKNDRVIFILRPEDLDLKDPVYEIKDPEGNPGLYIYDMVL